MAGLKETPRQKMIGMMYLVLLALLALQVSSAIMEKFKFLDDSLQYANSGAERSNAEIQQKIQTAVEQSGNRPVHVAILEKAKAVRQRSETLMTHIGKLREELLTTSGGLEDPMDVASMYKGAKDETSVAELMIAKKRAVELQAKVNGYCGELRSITGLKDAFPDIALDAQDDPRISKTSEQKKKKFDELNFAQTPMVAAMAVLSNMEAEVLKHESKALESLAEKVDAGNIPIDRIVARFKAESNTVVAGKKYKAELFMAATSSGIRPEIEVDGRNLSVNDDGVGNLEFTAGGGGYNELGFAKRKWSGRIKFKVRGRDTTFPVSGEYKVVKPYIDVQSAALTSLYKGCGNELKIACPPLGTDFQPSYTGSTGGDVIPQTEPGKVVIVPNSPTMKLKVVSSGTLLDEKVFPVRLIPLPTFRLRNGQATVSERDGLVAPFPSRLYLDVVPDESFQRSNPRDARYKAEEIEVNLVRRRKNVATKVFKNGVIDLGFIRDYTIQPGDRLVIEVKKVLRNNFRNEIEEVRASRIINLSLE